MVRSCPNQPRIRTPISNLVLVLSESATHSDSNQQFGASPVRISHAFGLQSIIWCWSCPNQPRIRTPISNLVLVLSESATHWDSNQQFGAASPVRISHAFGLQSVIWCSCPNQPRIRTPIGNLVRSCPNQPRIRTPIGNFVRSCPNQPCIRTTNLARSRYGLSDGR